MTGRQLRGVVIGVLTAFLLLTWIVPPARARADRILLLSAVAVAAWRVRTELGVGRRPQPEWQSSASALGPPDQQDVRVARLDASLELAAQQPHQFDRALRPLIRRLAETRLRSHHGIDVTTDPDLARQLMGDALWEMFAMTTLGPGALPDAASLAQLVAAVEKL